MADASGEAIRLRSKLRLLEKRMRIADEKLVRLDGVETTVDDMRKRVENLEAAERRPA